MNSKRSYSLEPSDDPASAVIKKAMGVVMSRLFPTSPMLELDHVQCCNANAESSSSDDDVGVVYSGNLNAVLRQILNVWPNNEVVDVHVRPRSTGILEPI